MSTASVPSLAEVGLWNADYLDESARSWTYAAQIWQDAYLAVYRQVQLPGGTEWTGSGADAALARVAEDRSRVGGAADALEGAAAAARDGARRLNAARELVLEAVDEARIAGFNVAEDYSVSSSGKVPLSPQTAVQAQSLASKIRHRVLALVAADREVAARISIAAAGLRGVFSDSVNATAPHRSSAFRAAGFDGMPLPEKPPNPVPEPPPGGWSQDPLMRAAQKIAYGHASDPITGHLDDFPGMTKDQLAHVIFQKFQRAITDPRGLRLGASNSDGVPVIYDPKDNVLIVRDTRPNAPDGGTVFKPDLAEDPNFVNKKFGWHESAFSAAQLADGPSTAGPAPPSVTALPTPSAPGGTASDPATGSRTFPGWGTYVPPSQAAQSGGPIGILGKIIEQFQQPGAGDQGTRA